MQEYTFDLQRIFLGDMSLWFLGEIALRTIILYGYSLLLIRFSPRRNLGQMTQLEVLLIIALGSAMGDPMFYLDVPLIHGMLVITLVILFHQLVISLTLHSKKTETIIEGDPIRLVADGKLDMNGMKQATMSHEDVFMQLRMAGYKHLGQIKRAYIETNGHVAVLKYDEKEIHAGLTLFPMNDIQDFKRYRQGERAPESAMYACYHDGEIVSLNKDDVFPNCQQCGKPEWVKYVVVPGDKDPTPLQDLHNPDL